MTTQTHDRDDDGDDDLAGIDSDVRLIVNYLNGELPAAQMVAVDQRLVTDETFFELAVPLIQVRHTRLNLTEKYGFVAPVPAPQPAPVAEHVNRPAMDEGKTSQAAKLQLSKDGAPARPRPVVHWLRQNYIIATMAATIVIAALLPALPSFEHAVGISGQHDAYSGDVTAVATARDFDLPNGGPVHLGPNSSVGYDARMSRHRLMVWLSGDATITVPPGQDSIIVVRNTGFVALAADGKYVLAAPAGDSRIRVAVIRGGATMTSFAQVTASLTLRAGETGDMSATPHFTGFLRDSSTGASMSAPSGVLMVSCPRTPNAKPEGTGACAPVPMHPAVVQDLLYRAPQARPQFAGGST